MVEKWKRDRFKLTSYDRPQKRRTTYRKDRQSGNPKFKLLQYNNNKKTAVSLNQSTN